MHYGILYFDYALIHRLEKFVWRFNQKIRNNMMFEKIFKSNNSVIFAIKMLYYEISELEGFCSVHKCNLKKITFNNISLFIFCIWDRNSFGNYCIGLFKHKTRGCAKLKVRSLHLAKVCNILKNWTPIMILEFLVRRAEPCFTLVPPTFTIRMKFL